MENRVKRIDRTSKSALPIEFGRGELSLVVRRAVCGRALEGSAYLVLGILWDTRGGLYGGISVKVFGTPTKAGGYEMRPAGIW
jgi:hypothetical protein